MPTRDQVLQIIIKRWKEEIGYGYKEQSMDQKKKKKREREKMLKDMKEEINDLHILALL